MWVGAPPLLLIEAFLVLCQRLGCHKAKGNETFCERGSRIGSRAKENRTYDQWIRKWFHSTVNLDCAVDRRHFVPGSVLLLLEFIFY